MDIVTEKIKDIFLISAFSDSTLFYKIQNLFFYIAIKYSYARLYVRVRAIDVVVTYQWHINRMCVVLLNY